MIQLCNRSVLTLREDGSTEFFQSDNLQKKLESSCHAAGLNEAWIAEDIALSVEYTLSDLGADKVFTLPEIDSIVIKILHEAGLGAVATHYQLEQEGETNLIFDKTNISGIIKRYLQLKEEEIASVVSMVSDAGKKLFLKEASPSLILELAKHYMNETSPSSVADSHSSPEKLNTCPWLISKEEILKNTSDKVIDFINFEVIELSDISRLFPSIRLQVKFANFAKHLGFTPPIPELLIVSFLAGLADTIDDIIQTAENIGSEVPEIPEDLPVYLKFADAPLFTETWLGGNWSNNKTCFEELVSELKELLKHEVFTYS
jgi:hypothetical protein